VVAADQEGSEDGGAFARFCSRSAASRSSSSFLLTLRSFFIVSSKRRNDGGGRGLSSGVFGIRYTVTLSAPLGPSESVRPVRCL
jgi:hypothetical protein